MPKLSSFNPWVLSDDGKQIVGWKNPDASESNSFMLGNVGIGTQTPAAKLDVTGGNIKLTDADAVIWGLNQTTNYLKLYNGGTNGVDISSSGPLTLRVNGGERARVDSNGHLGIGTGAAINAALHVTSANTGKPAATFYVNDAGTAVQNLVGFSVYNNVSNGLVDTTLVYGNTANSFLAIGHHNGTTYSERFRIDANGNLFSSTTSGTTLSTGFIYIPSAAGVPTGTPTAVSGQVPMYYDTTNNKFYIYNGAWKSVLLA